jgi:hypothetical protein
MNRYSKSTDRFLDAWPIVECLLLVILAKIIGLSLWGCILVGAFGYIARWVFIRMIFLNLKKIKSHPPVTWFTSFQQKLSKPVSRKELFFAPLLLPIALPLVLISTQTVPLLFVSPFLSSVVLIFVLKRSLHL